VVPIQKLNPPCGSKSLASLDRSAASNGRNILSFDVLRGLG
jgi:hypothetical protein